MCVLFLRVCIDRPQELKVSAMTQYEQCRKGGSPHSRRILLRPCFARLLATLVGRPDACGAGASPSEAELLRCIPADPDIFALELAALIIQQYSFGNWRFV